MIVGGHRFRKLSGLREPMVEGHESPGVNTRVVLSIAGGLLLFLIVFVVVLAFLFPDLIRRQAPVFASFPAPSVTIDERAERMLLDRTQKQRLSGVNGTVPIERAMAEIAARGIAAYDPAPGTGP
jgi:hypothetical protein